MCPSRWRVDIWICCGLCQAVAFPNCSARCNYERELWECVDQLDLFKKRIYLKGDAHSQINPVLSPSVTDDVLRHFSEEERITLHHTLFFWKRGDPHAFRQCMSYNPRPAHLRRCMWQNPEAVDHTPSEVAKQSACHSLGESCICPRIPFWWTHVRFTSKVGCLEPVASTWRGLVRPCVGPWSPRTASKERRQTSPNPSSTPHWWACSWLLTMRCAQHYPV